ncbi:uncharacterized protein LOC143293219 [Babylonia areolata]|uniref:uncharacterized protein LOC143293219 n=1 Tax=Babylonia areolata TaxID=304850 RepID=UPI003FCF15E8
MASKAQQQLNFPVRKSSRQSKPSRILQEANEQQTSTQHKRSERDSGTGSTPQRSRNARRKQGDCDSYTPCKMDCKPLKTPSSRRKQGGGEASPCKRDCTPQRTVSARRNLNLWAGSPSQRESTPVRGARARQKQLDLDTTSSCKSPSKRKAASLATPPTPPKSPCKSGSFVQKPASRCPSPEICSEESDSEDDDGQNTSKPFVQPHNVMSPSKVPHTQGSTCSLTPRAKGTLIPAKTTDCDKVNKAASREPCLLRSPKRHMRGPSELKTQALLPPPSPPLSPSVTASIPHPSDSKEHVSKVLLSTPTKVAQLCHLSQNNKALRTDSPQRSDMTCQHIRTRKEELSPIRTQPSTPQKRCACERVLSPHKNGACTPEKVSSCGMESPCGTSTSQKQLSQREILSPRKTLTSPKKLLTSPHKLPSPKKMWTQGNEENFTLKSPKMLPKLTVARQDNSGYQRAKQSLHTAKPDRLVGREAEVGEITTFLKTHLDNGSAGSLYISGAPGTGKTAALLHIIDDFKVQYKCSIAYLNCMMVKDVTSVFRRLYTELSGKPASGRTTVKDMEHLITSSKHSMILVLDEIDQLDSKNQEVLYTIFEWPSLLHSKLILTGVANALDLTDRILPRLQAKPRCRPKLLHFAPYTRNQITAIIQDRLVQTGDTIVENSAIQFCARKVAAVAGDMRKALDVCRRAVELAESESRSQTVLKVSDCNSPSKQQNGPAVKKIGVMHISKVMGEVYGSSVQAQQSEGVPLQQKLMVCTLLLVVKTGKFKEVPLGKLHEMYCKVCRRQQMTPVDQSEFHSVCVLLEARGVVGIKKAKETRLMKLTLRQDEKELEQTLKDKVLVSAILADGLPK